MAYDERGRWIPSEDINWSQDRQALREQLTETGLDWRHEGRYAFRTNDWGELSESQRLGVLQAYDSWYDTDVNRNINLADEDWGLDIERNISYNMDQAWSAQNFFHQMTGGNFKEITIGKDLEKKIVTKDRHGNVINIQYGSKGEGGVQVGGGSKETTGWDWSAISNPYKYKDKVRHTVVGEKVDAAGDTWTQIIKREHPMDWKNYTNDELYRATIDELLENDYMMFMGPGSDFDNATQVRAATKEIKSWVNEAYIKAHELGKDGAWAEAEWESKKALQIQQARVHNVRYPEGKNTRGFLHNQQVAIRKYQPWNKFDPETGTRTKVNPVTGEVRDTFKHKLVPEPTRMTIVGDKLNQNLDEGVFYSPTMGLEKEITDSMLAKPPDIPKPNLSIRGVTPERPANIDSGWKLKGDTKVTTQGAGS